MSRMKNLSCRSERLSIVNANQLICSSSPGNDGIIVYATGESLFDEMADQVIKRLRSDEMFAALARRRAEIQLQHLFGKSI